MTLSAVKLIHEFAYRVTHQQIASNIDFVLAWKYVRKKSGKRTLEIEGTHSFLQISKQ